MENVFVRNDEYVVKLTPSEMESFMAKAAAKADKYNELITDSPYGFNHAHSHLVGMVAEHATWELFCWIEQLLGVKLNIDPVFQDDNRDAECDLIVNSKRIEIKGMKYHSWLNYGPCISTKQYNKLKKKADVVVWVVLNEPRRELTFKGFNEIIDVRGIEPALTGSIHKVMNYQVRDVVQPLQKMVF